MLSDVSYVCRASLQKEWRCFSTQELLPGVGAGLQVEVDRQKLRGVHTFSLLAFPALALHAAARSSKKLMSWSRNR